MPFKPGGPNRTLGALVDATVLILTGVYTDADVKMGSMAYSHEYEAEADYVGCYLSEKPDTLAEPPQDCGEG